MNILAYVIAILNPLFLNSRGVSFRVGPMHTLANDISNLPHFPQDAFKYNGYHRVDHRGVYVSKDLQNFIYNGIGDRNDEGFILAIDFALAKLDPPNDPAPIAYVLQRADVNDAEIKIIDQYIRNVMIKPRSSRSLDKPKS